MSKNYVANCTNQNQEVMNMNNTEKVKVTEFNNWVAERIKVAETLIKGYKVPLDYRLSEREHIHEDFFENCFKSAYLTINEEIEDAKWKAEEAIVPEEVLETAIKAFKTLRAKVRREKKEYKKAFEKFQEDIDKSLKDEAYVQKEETLVADTVNDWCGTHKIKEEMKERFIGGKLQEQIHCMTINILTSRLYPNENELKETVERYMKYFTVQAA